MSVWFGLLGGVEVRVGGRPVAVGHARQQCVLAALLADAGQLVTMGQLADRVWGERQPQRARAALHSYLSRLRRVVAVAQDVSVERHGPGYVLRVDADAVDLHRFRGLVVRARTADDQRAVELFEEALALWRGEPLGVVESAWADEVRAALRQERLAAELERNDAALRHGGHERLLTQLSARVTEYPLDERLAGQLMLALYQSGRTADALDAYQRLRRQVTEELGVDPSEPLRRLQQQVLARDAALDPVSPRPHTAERTGPPPPRQLPLTVRHLVGRDAELSVLDAQLEALGGGAGVAIVIAITGLAGVGKTTLALSWARRVMDRFPDGQLYVDLRGFGPSQAPVAASEAVHRLLEALGVGPDRMPADAEGKVSLFRSMTEDRRLLLVLDNAHDTEQVGPLLPGGAGCLVLVTSRRQLTGLVVRFQAQPLALGTLGARQARELAVSRMGAARAGAEPEALDALVGRCAGLPLALSIAAARAVTNPAMPLRSLVDELREEHRGLRALAVVDGRDGDVLAVFSWSYRALSPQAARVFRLLALHPGPDLALPAVASLAGAPRETAEALLEELTDAGLLQRIGDRHLLHDLLRAYAGTQLTADEAASRRHAAVHRMLDHYLHTARAADRLLDEHRDPIPLAPPCPGSQVKVLTTHEQASNWLAAEHTVLVAAVAQAAATGFQGHAWRLAWTLTTHLQRRGSWEEWQHLQSSALRAAHQAGEADGIAHSRHGLALACSWAGRYDQARALLGQALAGYAELADETGQAHTRRTLSWVSQKQGRYAEALTHAVATLRHYTAADFPPGQASALNVIGWCQSLLGRHRQARTACRHALDLFERVGNRTGQAYTWDSLAHAHRGLGDHVEALTCYRSSLALFQELGDQYHQADTLASLGDTLSTLGERAEAQAAYRDALQLLESLGHQDADHVRNRLRTDSSH
ncbi:BTAD domain-containing putative transcriptional regulator [Streptomyces sp. NPDC057555]|uniref:AfsR/SARP family transcriptional regulator n=1 Tax=Streptomyces sp. NPDC057555 TaxID=3346166 RepID=UPI0036AC843E